MNPGHVVSDDEWLTSRKQLLIKDKGLTQLRDELSQQRRMLPWVPVDTAYRFIGPNGECDFAALFADHQQLIIYHFMMGVDWQEGCPSCSWWADNFNGIAVHLQHRDIAFAAVSNAPISAIEKYRHRMGWDFRWFSAVDSKFSKDLKVTFDETEKAAQSMFYNFRDTDWFTEELPGVSVFARDDAGKIYHTYSTYSRGLDSLNGAYQYIDLTPAGRNEENGMSWLRRHDQYE